MVEKVFAVAKELKQGKYVLIDDIPCRIVNIESSKPGKHGSAKVRLVAIGIFDGMHIGHKRCHVILFLVIQLEKHLQRE